MGGCGWVWVGGAGEPWWMLDWFAVGGLSLVTLRLVDALRSGFSTRRVRGTVKRVGFVVVVVVVVVAVVVTEERHGSRAGIIYTSWRFGKS